MLEKIGYAFIGVGAVTIAAKQPLTVFIWGDWTFPDMDKVQSLGICTAIIGAALVFYHFSNRKQ